MMSSRVSSSKRLSQQPRPVIIMSKFKMEFYEDWTGVNYTGRWRNREHWLAGRHFLERLLGASIPSAEDDNYFVLENEQQLKALIAFRRELEKDT